MGRAAAGALAAFAGGLLADRLGGPTAVAIAGVVGSACALGYVGLRARSDERAPAFSARDPIRALRERPVLAKMALAQGFYGGGFIAAAPLYALVFVDRLDLTLGQVGVIGILASVSTTIAFLDLGRRRRSIRAASSAIRIGSAIGVTSLIGYAFAPDVAVLWFAAIAAGTASASIDVGDRRGRERPNAARPPRRRDGRLERADRRPGHRRRVPDERAAPGRPRRRDLGPAAVRGVLGDRGRAIRQDEAGRAGRLASLGAGSCARRRRRLGRVVGAAAAGTSSVPRPA